MIDRRQISLASLCGFGLAAWPVRANRLPPSGGVVADAQQIWPELDRYLEASRQRLGIPGSLVAVVQGGRTVAVKGYGVRALGGSLPMTASTAVSIASNSKAFSAAVIASLVDSGKLGWESRVVDLVPGFRTADPYITAHLTVRDVLAHRTGIDADYMNNLNWTMADALATMPRQLARPAWFRSRFLYNDIAYTLVDSICRSVAGLSWHDAVRARLLQPLGLSQTTLTAAALEAAPDHAASHEHDIDGRLRADPIDSAGSWSMDYIAPAGAVNSTAGDMAAWMSMLLAKGTAKGQQILSPAVVTEMMTPHIPYDETDIQGATPLGYGLGLAVDIYQGQRLVWHTGRFRGQHSMMMLVPDWNLGVFIFGNSSIASEAWYTTGTAKWIVDRTLGLPQVDHVADTFEKFNADLAAKRARREATLSRRVAGTRPRLELSAYTGRYVHPVLGPWDVSLASSGLTISKPDTRKPYSAPMTHWHFNSFRTVWNEDENDYRPSEFATFELDARLNVTGLDLTTEIWSAERPPTRLARI